MPGDVLFTNEPRSIEQGALLSAEPRRTSRRRRRSRSRRSTAARTRSPPSTIVAGASGRRSSSAICPRRATSAAASSTSRTRGKNAANPNYQPVYLPVDVGTEQPGAASRARSPTTRSTRTGSSPTTSPSPSDRSSRSRGRTSTPIDAEGVGAEVVGAAKTSGANPAGDPLAVPIIAMTQDAKILAAPDEPDAADAHRVPAELPLLEARVGRRAGRGRRRDRARRTRSTSSSRRCRRRATAGSSSSSRGAPIAENPLVPGSLAAGGVREARRRPVPHASIRSRSSCRARRRSRWSRASRRGPSSSSRASRSSTTASRAPSWGRCPRAPTTAALRDHVTVLVRPAALCFDPRRIDAGGLLVTPHLTGRSADASEAGDKPLFDPKSILKQPHRSRDQGRLPARRGATRSRSCTRPARRGRSRTRWAAARASEGDRAPSGDISTCVREAAARAPLAGRARGARGRRRPPRGSGDLRRPPRARRVHQAVMRTRSSRALRRRHRQLRRRP